MPALPTGTVTFLLTDVEGSTRLWEEHPEHTRTALVQHDALVETLVGRHRGRVVKPRGEGESHFCVFVRGAGPARRSASATPVAAPLDHLVLLS
jgi:class 3 adenylate cyclase